MPRLNGVPAELYWTLVSVTLSARIEERTRRPPGPVSTTCWTSVGNPADIWRNCGQTATLWAALDLARGEILQTPLPSLTVMFFLAGGMSILLGIQSELIMRTYYESQAKTTYLLREVRQGSLASTAGIDARR
jgi:hypothetical protein